MSRYMPVYFYPDQMPVDISFVFENEKPAGKHGFCQVKGDQFAFEDGTPAKFWGVIFNGACCFPKHDYAEGVAERLAQAGCNIVRFHQMDAEWATPNIFRLTAGKCLVDTRHFDPRCMERMDYLIKCLKDQGIYITTDVTTYRKFKSGDGVVDADLLTDNMKGVTLYDPKMIELQKEYAYNFWNHVNPYTGLAYKDDPVFVMVDITNENDMFIHQPDHKCYSVRSKYYDDMFRDMFAAWLKEQGIDYDAYGCELYNTDQPMVDFRVHLGKKFYEEMRNYLRDEVGVKIPITGTNWSIRGGLVKSQENMDFQDGHRYFYDWRWGENEKATFNRHLTEEPVSCLGGACSTRIHGQPFFMTEWDMPWPNSYRAEAPIWFPAIACLQGWSGMTIHTYAYGTKLSERDPNLIVYDTGEVWRNVAKRMGAVDTPRTKAVYGMLSTNNANNMRKDMEVKLNGMVVDCYTDFATIALSSLTDAPIEHSHNMLLSTIGRSHSRGALFDGEKLLDFGTGPIEVEVIDAVISIKTDVPRLRVWSVNSEGYYVGRVPAEYEDGWFKFHVGPNYPGMYYLIMQE